MTTTRPSPVLHIGLLASGALTVAALLDLAVIGSLAENLVRIYTPYGVPWQAAEAVLTTAVLVAGVAGMAGWLALSRGAARRRRWAAPAGTVLFVLGLGVAVALLTAQEYGQALLPTWLGLLGLLPSAVGIVAVVRLWRDRPALVATF